ncbi:hypothetical protein [Burkholderia multivorans]|uniref:hypothetical protein n=1 Tax=Burkholderia multivorans TaxID=87883 RepID=UPI0015923C5D|nr:hypothetical protein [Burkholderia multivorans]MBH9663494.1 hypothetical protein [Burkholderia multivorans]MBU9239868.1 hypothetical protein [Burkholderia multivorans]MBU9362919.1 hypothetical protein [Burkholderia multivorans]MBU9595621.1 hypothetical protein [Burkholderia multivorans]MBU9650021.1 hypothetical protein [Burkholderia multivorans]
MTNLPQVVPVEATGEKTLAELHAAMFTTAANAVHAAPQAELRTFQIFSLYDAATPVVYTNHTR